VNNEKFKEFIAPLLDRAVNLLGGIHDVQAMYEQLPEPTIYFVTGVIHGLAPAHMPLWRNDEVPLWRNDEARSIVSNFTHEEKRRMLDYVRLRLETRSGSS
jgi:hypothetical protein